MSYEKLKRKTTDSIFVEAEATCLKGVLGDNIEGLYAAVTSVHPFENDDNVNDIDVALGILHRSECCDDTPDEELEAMKKQLEL